MGVIILVIMYGLIVMYIGYSIGYSRGLSDGKKLR